MQNFCIHLMEIYLWIEIVYIYIQIVSLTQLNATSTAEGINFR